MRGNAISGSFFVGDWRTIQIAITGSGGADFSVRFPGSTVTSVRLVDVQPDFNSSDSETNEWEYVGISGIADFVNYDGSTGIVIESDRTYLLNIETNGLIWIGAEIFDYSSGMATVEMTMLDRYGV